MNRNKEEPCTAFRGYYSLLWTRLKYVFLDPTVVLPLIIIINIVSVQHGAALTKTMRYDNAMNNNNNNNNNIVTTTRY